MKNETTLYPRRCDVTEEGMNEGYVTYDLKYFKYDCDLIDWLRSIGGEGWNSYDDDQLMDAGYEEYLYYWTQWEELDEDENYLADGTLVPVEDMVIYLGKKTTIKDMVVDLRKRGVDKDGNISDEFLINEAYQLGEWNHIN
jgi:hypothetical protein